MNPLKLAPLMLLLAAGLAGCTSTNGADGQSASAEGSLAYNGASAGTHQAKADCASSGTFNWSSNLGSGSVTVTVLDANGATAYSKTLSNAGQSAESKPVSGAAGEWTIKVERKATSQYGSSMWSGQYAAYLDC